MRTRCRLCFASPSRTPCQTHWLARLRWLPDRLPGRLSDSQIAGKRPSGVDRRSCRAYPLGHPAGARAGRTFCNPRTSCGDTNGSTLHVAKQVRGIQNPQSCRQAHRKSRFPSAPFLKSTLFKQTNEHGLCRVLSMQTLQAD